MIFQIFPFVFRLYTAVFRLLPTFSRINPAFTVFVFCMKDYINNKYLVMVNPKIIRKSSQFYEIEEGCLSLNGQRKAVRYKSVTVEFLDRNFKKKTQTFKDFEAQIIQHEIDHFNGILI